MTRRKFTAKPAPNWAESAVAVARGSESIEIEDAKGNRVAVSLAHWRRWPSVRETFRPVADAPDTAVSIDPPTGDKTEEN